MYTVYMYSMQTHISCCTHWCSGARNNTVQTVAWISNNKKPCELHVSLIIKSLDTYRPYPHLDWRSDENAVPSILMIQVQKDMSCNIWWLLVPDTLYDPVITLQYNYTIHTHTYVHVTDSIRHTHTHNSKSKGSWPIKHTSHVLSKCTTNEVTVDEK